MLCYYVLSYIQNKMFIGVVGKNKTIHFKDSAIKIFQLFKIFYLGLDK